MPARSRDTGTYGHAHRKACTALKAAMRDGDPCARCGRPMHRSELPHIHGDHVGIPRVLGGGLPDGLSHSRCNLSHGARLGNRLRGARRRAGGVESGRLPEW